MAQDNNQDTATDAEILTEHPTQFAPTAPETKHLLAKTVSAAIGYWLIAVVVYSVIAIIFFHRLLFDALFIITLYKPGLALSLIAPQVYAILRLRKSSAKYGLVLVVMILLAITLLFFSLLLLLLAYFLGALYGGL